MSRQLKALAPVAALVALFPSSATANLSERDAVSTAQCSLSSFNWAFNSLNQSPCLIGAYAQSACTGGNYVVGPLNPGYVYTGPTTADQANPCRCSVPVWNIISACGACQNASANPWDKWHAGCSSTTTYYPEDIPAGTRIPGWAYLPVPADFAWDAAAAQADANAPESLPPSSASASSSAASSTSKSTVTAISSTATTSATNSQTTTKNGGSSGTSAGGGATGSGSSGVIVSTVTAANPSATGSSDSSSGGGGSNTGAIAGGVVGGVVGLALIAGILFWLQRRHRHEPVPTEPPYNPPMNQYSPPPVSGGYGSSYAPSSGPVYNPNDPSTYPSSSPAPGQPQYYQAAANPFQTPLATPSGPPAGYGGSPMYPNRGYTGTPEVQHSG